MKVFSLVPAALLASCLGGCQATPMTYAQWKKEQDDKLAFKKAGLEYKSPAQLKAEATEMKKTGEETSFAKDVK